MIRWRRAICKVFSDLVFCGISWTLRRKTDSLSVGRPWPWKRMRKVCCLLPPSRLSGGVMAKGTSCAALLSSDSIQDWIMMSCAAWFLTRIDASLLGACSTTRVPPRVTAALARLEESNRAPTQRVLENNRCFMMGSRLVGVGVTPLPGTT
ncbi:hypothetical protein D9M68_819410 [compost metagenome]